MSAAVAALVGVTAVPAAQAWRASAVASFDLAWQTINDTFYDPAFGGLDWAGVARELRPRVESASSPEEARDVIRQMLGRLKRSHFALLSASAAEALPGPAAVPADVRITPDGALVTKVTDEHAAAEGLAPGQIVLAVDGQAVADLVGDVDAADPRTRDLQAWRRVNRALHGGDGSMAALRVREPDGRQRDLRVSRSRGQGEVITLGNLPPLRVRFEDRDLTTPGGRRAGFISFSVWMTNVSEPISMAIDRFRGHDGIIIDLRGNPGGLASMMSGVAGHFVAEPVLLGSMRTRQVTLKFDANPRLATTDGRRVDVFRGPLALLVDELTGSTSETFVGALQDLGRARVFGRQTMGQALPALTKQLPMGDVLIYAIGDFTTSKGRSIEGAGITPDTVIPLSPRALARGQDQALEAALRWIDAARTPGRGPS